MAAVNAEIEVAVSVAQQIAWPADLIAPRMVNAERVVAGQVAKPEGAFAFIAVIAILVGVLEVGEVFRSTSGDRRNRGRCRPLPP